MPWIRPRREPDGNCLMPSQPCAVGLEARIRGKALFGKREYVQVLRLVETFDLEVLHGDKQGTRVGEGRPGRRGAIGDDFAVKHLVLCRIERRPPKLDLDIYP